MLDRIKNEVSDKPGCYLYKNKSGKIIYVGKAKNLKKRMSSYFNRIHNIKTSKLVSEIYDFEIIITNTERESLILENNLIKKHNPHYNILLKDDKRYPYILLTKEKHPRLLKVRDRKIDGSYFGPYPSSFFVNEIIKFINSQSVLRKCRVLPSKECIYYHLKQCYAPCIKEFSQDTIKMHTDSVKKLLSNDLKTLNLLIEKKMYDSSQKMDFEKAQKYKELMDLIGQYKIRQGVELSNDLNIRVIGSYEDGNWISLAIVEIKDGIVHNINRSLHPYDSDNKYDVLISYLYEYFDMDVEYFICDDDELSDLVEGYLFKKRVNQNLVEYSNLKNLAVENANEYFKNNVDKLTKLYLENKKSGLEELEFLAKKQLNIIEAYDISHIQGDAQVGVKVSFINGVRTPKLYRKYKISEENKKDEYGSMKEVLTRRFSRMLSENQQYPDLIILDGGKGQIGVCLKVMQGLSIDGIKVVGLVKDDKHTTNILMNSNFSEYELDISSALYRFLYSIQEEVHRFAIDFHRKSKSNSMFSSKLDEIIGLGPKRKKLLVTHFGSTDEIAKANIEELVELKIPLKVAKMIVKVMGDISE